MIRRPPRSPLTDPLLPTRRSSDLAAGCSGPPGLAARADALARPLAGELAAAVQADADLHLPAILARPAALAALWPGTDTPVIRTPGPLAAALDRKSTRLNSSH